ncbi:MAG: GvpL/GvpF family gas vesicle protein [Bacillota bacterium]
MHNHIIGNTGENYLNELSGRYVYCVTIGTPPSLGPCGLNGAAVEPIFYRNICALTHLSLPAPYQGNAEELINMVLCHGNVVDTVWAQTGHIVPVTFNTIIIGKERTAEENVRLWLSRNYNYLVRMLHFFAGKVELGVQINWDKDHASAIFRKTTENRVPEPQDQARTKGTAYLLKRQREKIHRQIMAATIQEAKEDYYRRLARYTDDVREGKIQDPVGKLMILNASILVKRPQIGLVGDELATLSRKQGVEVKFTGPWPPYSFVCIPEGTEDNNQSQVDPDHSIVAEYD